METRARVWDAWQMKWCGKCPNYLLCRGANWKMHTKCIHCVTDTGVPPTCKVVAASTYCCICLEDEKAHLLLPCGHKVGVKCADKMLFAQFPYFEPTAQEFGCPSTQGLDDQAAAAVEAAWKAADPAGWDAFQLLCVKYEVMEEEHRYAMRQKLEVCPLCRQLTGV